LILTFICSVRNHRDKEYTNSSLLVYGNGDGGGGPLAGMIERLKRMENVDGLAKVKMGSATEFYESIERSGAELSSWKGELVSQSKTSCQNLESDTNYLTLTVLRIASRNLHFARYHKTIQSIMRILTSRTRNLCHYFHDRRSRNIYVTSFSPSYSIVNNVTNVTYRHSSI
jgi:hypothetical protein